MEKFRNLEKVLEVLENSIEKKNIAVYGDYDVDGLMALITFKDTLAFAGHKNTFLYPYYSRTHEIDFNFLNFCLSRKINLVIICDTGSDNMSLLQQFCDCGMECIILDHHATSNTYDDFPKNCTVINTYIDNILYDIKNEMCGGSIAFVVCSTLLSKIGIEYDIGYLATYALMAQYADAIPMDTEFGRFLYETTKIRQSVPQCIDYFLESYNDITRRFAEYTFSPKINAVFRREQFSLINKLFLEPTSDAFLLINQIKDLHVSTISIVDSIVKTLPYENVGGIIVANLTPLLNSSLPNNFVSNHKGRVANAIANIEEKPCICVVDSGKRIEGSFRDMEGRNFLKYFSPLFKAGGHPPAFGFSLPYTDWPYFYKTVGSVGKMVLQEGDQKIPNPEYDMTRWLDLEKLREIAYENEFASPRNPATYVWVNLTRVVEATRFGLAYLLHSDGVEDIWFTSEKKIPFAQPVLLYPYLQRKLKVKAVWK